MSEYVAASLREQGVLKQEDGSDAEGEDSIISHVIWAISQNSVWVGSKDLGKS